MPTSSILVLTGSLGSGKTTVARLLAERLPRGAHIESDLFYGFFGRPVLPHLPEAHGQNKAAIAAACQAAKSLCLNGYNVVLDGVLGPWFVPLMRSELSAAELTVQYVVLRTSLKEALERVRRRGDASMEKVVTTTHPQFENLGQWETHVLDASSPQPLDIAMNLLSAFGRDVFCLSSDSGALANGA